jgi:hypothetical protein
VEKDKEHKSCAVGVVGGGEVIEKVKAPTVSL